MAMIRVPPGTIPREPPRDRLKDFYDLQGTTQAFNEFYKKRGDLNEAMSGRVGQFAAPLTGPLQKEEPENIDRFRQSGGGPTNISDTSTSLPDFTGERPKGFWGRDSSWQSLTSYQKAAAMALLEANASGGRPNFVDARNAMGAMINRADKEGQDLGDHVSRKIYQPTIEPAQYARLQTITRSPEFQALTNLAESRESGQTQDWVDGATHFLAKPSTMLKLESENPDKYKSWRKWTGYDDETGRYKNEVMADSSHVFLAPEGKHSAGQPLVDAQNTNDPTQGLATDAHPYVPPPPPPTSLGTEGAAQLPTPTETPEGDRFLSRDMKMDMDRLPKSAGNPLEDLQSKPITIGGLEQSPDQEQASFALLPSQRMRSPSPSAPTLPTPRRPPGFGPA